MAARQKAWKIFPYLTKKVWKDHADAGMLGGSHDPEHAVRVAQMALEIAEDETTGMLAAAAGLCHNADRILQCVMKIGRRQVPAENIQALIVCELSEESCFSSNAVARILKAVLGHDGKNQQGDDRVLVTLMDADRLVNAEPDLIIRSGQFLHDLPAVDPIHLWSNPEASYRDPRSVLRDVMETIVWLTPGDDNPFYVRLPKAREIAARRKKFFDDFARTLIECRIETGFYPYPPELLAIRNEFLPKK